MQCARSDTCYRRRYVRKYHSPGNGGGERANNGPQWPLGRQRTAPKAIAITGRGQLEWPRTECCGAGDSVRAPVASKLARRKLGRRAVSGIMVSSSWRGFGALGPVARLVLAAKQRQLRAESDDKEAARARDLN